MTGIMLPQPGWPTTEDRVDLEVGTYAAEPWSRPASLVVPTDGSLGSDAAVVIARKLALRDALPVELLTVLERPLISDAPLVAGTSYLQMDLATKQALWRQIEDQRRRLAPTATRWPVTFEEGDAARVIAAIGRERLNPLLVMGLGTHGVVERLVGRELALDVIRKRAAPVLAVHPDHMRLPRTAVAALDFSPASLEAARLAVHLLGDHGTLYLTYVQPSTAVPLAEPAPWETMDEMKLRILFGELRAKLNAPAGVLFEPVVLHGDPARAILAFAAEQGIELIAAGTHGYTALERMLMGSVSTRLVRSASCSVLVAAPRN